jgi:uncharacterized protein
MKVIKTIAWILVVIGALNWGLIGLFGGINLVTAIFGSGIITKGVYILVGISGLVVIFANKCKYSK